MKEIKIILPKISAVGFFKIEDDVRNASCNQFTMCGRSWYKHLPPEGASGKLAVYNFLNHFPVGAQSQSCDMKFEKCSSFIWYD